jgi:hypothetical protein
MLGMLDFDRVFWSVVQTTAMAGTEKEHEIID